MPTQVFIHISHIMLWTRGSSGWKTNLPQPERFSYRGIAADRGANAHCYCTLSSACVCCCHQMQCDVELACRAFPEGPPCSKQMDCSRAHVPVAACLWEG